MGASKLKKNNKIFFILIIFVLVVAILIFSIFKIMDYKNNTKEFLSLVRGGLWEQEVKFSENREFFQH